MRQSKINSSIEPSATTPAARSTYHHGSLRDALVMHGIKLLDTEGHDALTLRRAARDVGVSQTAPMNHFDGKVGYLAAVAAQGFRMLFEKRIQSLQGKLDPRSRLMAILMVHIQFAIDHGALFRLMFGTEIPEKSTHDELWSAITLSYGLLETCVADYLAGRSLSRDQLASSTFAAWTACHGLALLVINREDSSSIARMDPLLVGKDVLEIFVTGLDHQSQQEIKAR